MTSRRKQKESRSMLDQVLSDAGYTPAKKKPRKERPTISESEMKDSMKSIVGCPTSDNLTALEKLNRKPVEELGVLKGQFYLPLELAPPLNSFAEMPNWLRHRLKRQALNVMFIQYNGRARSPIAGKPVVYAVRFSSKQPDSSCGWHKIAIDRLSVKHQGLGLLIDDNPDYLTLCESWRKVPPGKGFVYIEVWSGNEHGVHS